MNGSDYVALVRLSTKTDETLAEVGERCDRVPAASLAWLEQCAAVRYAPLEVPRVLTTAEEAE